jgi:cbb3-type cytochrome oxidase cytochrome c subunit
MPALLWNHRPRRLVLLLLAAACLVPGGTAALAEPPPPPDPIPAIPGFARFYSGPGADAVKGGQLLLGELSCTSCHRPDAAQEAFLLRRQAPVLDGVGARVKRAYLRKFLRDPQAVKPGTTMPHVLAGLPEQERGQRVEELVHFLASTAAPRQDRPEPKLIATGRDVYHRIGCVACHGTRTAAGRADKQLPTSVPLGDLRAKYSLAGLTAFLENPHQVRPSGRMPGLLQGQEARAVANYLLQGVAFVHGTPNMTYAYYEGHWDRLPNFAKLRPTATGKTSDFDLGVARRSNDYALQFQGYLRLDRDGDYRFHITSDDGSRLVIDGKQVVVNDGVHAPSAASGAVRLAKGTHKLVVSFFNGPGGAELQVDVEGPGLGRQPVAGLVSLTPEGNPKVPADPAAQEEMFPINPALVEKGQQDFAALGCASCHQLKVGAGVVQSKLTAMPLAKLRPDAGCLSATPARGVPHFAFTGPQRAALAAAVRALAQPPAARPGPRVVIARTMTALNCYACHDRDKVGGVEDTFNHSFVTTQPEMGDEGRIPPSLTGVGAKLTHDWLRHVLADGAHDRPYMHTHMPRFGEANTAELVKAFEAVDATPAVAKVAFAEKPAKVKAQGRFLVGAQAFGCIKCHTFAGHKAEGVQGIDMTLMTRRLRRDWFHPYLIDPQKYRPGTRMPSAWPGGVSVLPDVLGGSAAKQIEAIWVYLEDGNRALLPLGVRKHSIPLIPVNEAIIYRNFIEGAGPRAIGVGYPEKASLAFDANDLRLAMIWQGAFIDAARHWTDRGAGYEPPLGDNILHLAPGVSFAVLAKEADPWPTKAARQMTGYKFLGYRLTRDQRPTFLYSCLGARVEDFPEVAAGKSAPVIRRKLDLTAPQPVEGLYFRAAVADKIEPAGGGWFRVNGEWRMRIEAGAMPRVRTSAGKQELLVPVRFEGGRAHIVQEFNW